MEVRTVTFLVIWAALFTTGQAEAIERNYKESRSGGRYSDTDGGGCLDRKCLRCKKDWYRLIYNNVPNCFKNCPPGYTEVEHKSVKLCGRCPFSCKTCLNRWKCDQCNTAKGFIKVVHDGKLLQCSRKCPGNFRLVTDKNGKGKSCVKGGGRPQPGSVSGRYFWQS